MDALCVPELGSGLSPTRGEAGRDVLLACWSSLSLNMRGISIFRFIKVEYFSADQFSSSVFHFATFQTKHPEVTQFGGQRDPHLPRWSPGGPRGGSSPLATPRRPGVQLGLNRSRDSG
ncbi:hypothetical protein J6590_021172 [Homalodisca vitripennis]|nr:hypothetical protein J6590_021172 [Homalodisca vitripennis]